MKINQAVLMSGPEQFRELPKLNPLTPDNADIDSSRAQTDHEHISDLLVQAGVEVIKVAAPGGANCQDGVYTANWALVVGEEAIMSNLPPQRKGEELYAERVLRGLGKKIIKVPGGLHFSGQGDALLCGKYLFAGCGYRTDSEVHKFLAETLPYEVVGLRTLPLTDEKNQPVINATTGWPDSFFYDLDLALAVIKPDLIAWCPEAFTAKSRAKIRSIQDLQKIEVSLKEAKENFACNLVSTGETVIMSDSAPELKANLKAKGLKILSPEVKELVKGGGFIRCTSLTLTN